MSITITITDPTPEQIAALFGAQEAAPARAAGKAKDEPASAKKEEPAPSAKTESSTASDEPDASPSDVPTAEDVTAAAQALVKANSREALAELLGEFDAKNLSGVKEGDRAAFIAKCEEKSK